MTDERATVLVVEDEPNVAEMYAAILEDSYSVRVAAGGEAALDAMDGAVDVVLLDRRMPGMAGSAVLSELRDRGYDCPVVMVTAVDADFDVVSMSFNEYLTKPVSADALRATVERVLALSERDVQVQEYFALVAKRRELEVSKPEHELAESEAYAELTDRIATVRERIDPDLTEFEERVADRLADTRPDSGDEPLPF